MSLSRLRQILRALGRNPGFALAAIVALGVGIGANTAMFSVVDGVLLRPLPYTDADRLVLVRSTMQAKALNDMPQAAGDFYDYASQNQVFAAMAAWQGIGVGLTNKGSDPERFIGAFITPGFFDVFQVQPAAGRFFAKEEWTGGKDDVVILSHGLWQERFAGRASLLGETIELNGRNRLVIGIAPPGFAYPSTARLWMPAVHEGHNRTRRDLHNQNPVARLKSGVSVTQAQTDIAGIAGRLAKAYPEFDADKGVVVKPMLDAAVGNVRPALWVLLGAVGFVLAIACANVANLLLARGASRAQEMAVRASLGAARTDLFTQLMGEALVLAAAGGALGLAIAYALFRWLKWLAPAGLPRLDSIALDTRALIFTACAATVTGVLFGLLPALRLSGVDLSHALKERVSAGTARGRLRQALVVAQIALALVLLAGAGLLMRTFYELNALDLGFNPESLLTMQVAPLQRKYGASVPLQIDFARRITQELAQVPGVRKVGIATNLPLLGNPRYIMRFEGRAPVTVANAPIAAFATVTPDYFSALGARLERGRLFDDQDNAGKPNVCLINQSLARKFFPNEDPLGKRLEIGFDDPPNWRQIVGIIADQKNFDLTEPAQPQVYAPFAQGPTLFVGTAAPLVIAVRTAADPASLANALRQRILAIDNAQPVYAIQTMNTVISDSIGAKRFALLLMALFAAIALLLAAIGLAGVISYMVARRTREIGIRMALGAERSRVLWMVENEAVRMAAAGVAVGLAGALLLGRYLSSMLYGVSPRDPLTLSLVAAVLLLIALGSAFVPAWKATRIDPVTALRQD